MTFSVLTAAARSEIYTLSLHDALPISSSFSPRPKDYCQALSAGQTTESRIGGGFVSRHWTLANRGSCPITDRKSTRLNSSHPSISYAVFCLKKKMTTRSSWAERDLWAS